MEKFLGKNYKWWYLLKFSFKSVTNYRVSNIFYSLGALLTTFPIVFVWYINLQSGSNIYTFNEVFTYFVLGIIVLPFFSNRFENNLSRDITSGRFTSKLLNSSGVWGQYQWSRFGQNFFWNLDSFIWLIFLIIGRQYFIFPASFFDIWMFLFLCIMMFLQTYFISVIVGSVSFFITDNFGFLEFFSQLKLVLSGRIFPLDISNLVSFMLFTPFAFSYFFPMQFYLGKYDFTSGLPILIGGFAWILVLFLIANIIYKIGLKRYESVGL